MRKLNPYRVSDWMDAMANARQERERGRRRIAAEWLRVAGVIRANAWKPWDYELSKWVCRCCMLVLANGECCADDVHNGDSLPPLGLAEDTDSWMPGGEHVDGCDREDCGCERNKFSTSQCSGCGTYLHGSRYAVTVFVNDRRNQPVSA